ATFVSASGAGWACSATSTTVTCTRASIAAGDGAPTILVVVTAPGRAATLTDRAQVTNTVHDPDLANNSATATTSVRPSADLSLVKTGPASVVAGARITYTLVVSNAGPDAAASVRVTDTLPAGLTFVSAAGSGWTCTHDGDVTVTCTRAALASPAKAPAITVVVGAPASPTTVTNHAAVTSATYDPLGSNDVSSAPTEVLPFSASGGSSGGMPKTGADVLLASALGLALVVLGLGLLLAAGRRRHG
ncbi:MAG TPA: DUF11 domain-containing protein, partial [Actinomycetes bacterium]|nr:DUF11 domain-containing protein [Actinomycetes bacterium]